MADLRAIWEYVGPRQFLDDDEIAVTVQQNGVLFEVTQEKAVDSYNASFTCSCLVPFERAAELVAMLSTALAAYNEKEHGTNA